MSKLNQRVQQLSLPNKLLIGSLLCLLFFGLKKYLGNTSTDELWNSKLSIWLSIPFLLLGITIPFFVLYLTIEKQEKLSITALIACVISIAALALFFI